MYCRLPRCWSGLQLETFVRSFITIIQLETLEDFLFFFILDYRVAGVAFNSEGRLKAPTSPI